MAYLNRGIQGGKLLKKRGKGGYYKSKRANAMPICDIHFVIFKKKEMLRKIFFPLKNISLIYSNLSFNKISITNQKHTTINQQRVF